MELDKLIGATNEQITRIEAQLAPDSPFEVISDVVLESILLLLRGQAELLDELRCNR